MMETDIKEAVNVLKRGGTILYPTDTIWGIGCDATNSEAVESIYRIKRRSNNKSMIVLASDIDMINRYVQKIPDIAYSLIELNDKPMTIIYPSAVGLAENVIADDGSIGIRIPLNDFCIKLIKYFGRPIVSTSANISGDNAPRTFSEISDEISGSVDFIAGKQVHESATHKASQIIKIGIGGEIEILRK